MERDKQIKLGVAGVLGLAAVVILAMNLLGGPKKAKETDNAPPEVQKKLSTRGQAPRAEK